MAHKMDQSKGQTAFVAYQQAAWHNLGTVKNTVLTLSDCLKEGGLDFNVQKLPNRHLIPGIPKPIISEESFFTYRTDVNKVLGDKLGKDYIVYQNAEALQIVDEILKSKKVSIETAGAVDEGRKVFICLKIHDVIKISTKDVVEQYLVIVNSHDGRLAITALLTNVRVVCHNTLSAALNGAKHQYKIRHTKNAMQRTREAMEILGLSEQNRKQNEAAYNAMKHNAITKEDFYNYIGNIFMSTDEIKELQKGNTDAVSTRKTNIINSVLEFAENGVGQKEALGNNLNMWHAYNAVTGYATSKKYADNDNRFNSLMFGTTLNMITDAGNLALNPHKIQTLKAVKPQFNLN
jgi:phage/plasmid-like protein (TIGR03299 family)